MSPVSVMVVEDSPVARELIVATLNSDPRLSVVASVESAERALRLIPRMAPDVVCMDVRLPGMNGIEATRRIMEECPTPIIVVAADLRSETINKSMEALGAGALSVVEKPTIESVASYQAMARSLCNQFVNLSQVKVVRQRFNGSAHRIAALETAYPGPGLAKPAVSDIEVVGIVASTGGPAAVSHVLQGLPADLPVPVLVVQHMGAEFLEGYADWLNSICGQTVELARNLQVPLPGHVYVGPSHHHLTYAKGRLALEPAAGSRGHVPSGDVLLDSLAAIAGPRSIGVLLTGMGDDGAHGLLRMHKAGALTIAQDKATSAIYGMPAVAAQIGAAVEILPIDSVAGCITEAVMRVPKVRQAS